MGIVFRQAIKTSIVNGSGVLLGALTLWMGSKILSQAQLGGSRLLTYQAVTLQFFLLLGAAHTVFAFTQRYAANAQQKRALITAAAITPILASLLFCLPYYFFRHTIISKFQLEDQPFMRSFYGWLPVYGALYGLMTLLEYYLYACYKSAPATFMREVVLRLCNILLLVAFYYRWLNFYQFIAGTVLVTALPIALLLIVATGTKDFGFSFRWEVFNKAERREMLRYTWYHLLTGASLNLLPYLDSLILGPLHGLEDVAIYTNAQFIAGVMMFAYRAMGTAAIPDINDAYLQKDRPRLSQLFRRASLNTQIVAAVTWLIIICNLPNIVAILPKNYAAVMPLVFILSIGRMADMFTGLNAEMLSVSAHYRINLWVTAGQVVLAVLLDRLLIPKYGTYGAAAVSSFAVLIFNIAKTYFLYRKEGLQPFYNGTWKTLAATGLIYLIDLAFPATGRHLIVDGLLRSAALVILFMGCMLVLQPSPDLKIYIQQIRQRRRLF